MEMGKMEAKAFFFVFTWKMVAMCTLRNLTRSVAVVMELWGQEGSEEKAFSYSGILLN